MCVGDILEKHAYIKKCCYASGFINECKSCQILSNVFQGNVFIFKIKKQTGYGINVAKQNYLVAAFCMVCLMNQMRVFRTQSNIYEGALL